MTGASASSFHQRETRSSMGYFILVVDRQRSGRLSSGLIEANIEGAITVQPSFTPITGKIVALTNQTLRYRGLKDPSHMTVGALKPEPWSFRAESPHRSPENPVPWISYLNKPDIRTP